MRSMVEGARRVIPQARSTSRSSTSAPAAHVFGRGVFRDIVADAARARHEDHAGRADGGQHLRVVARAARQPFHRQLELPRDRLDAGNQLRRKGTGSNRASVRRSTVTSSAAAVSATKAARRRSASLSLSLSVLRRSTVITARSATTLTRLGVSVSAPTVATCSPPRSRASLSREGRNLCRDVTGVAAHPHRRRAGVVRLAGQRQLGPGDALHALDRADGETLRLQRRPLFDVQFDIGVDVGLADRRVAGIADAPRAPRRRSRRRRRRWLALSRAAARR